MLPKNFAINVVDQNDAPTSVSLSSLRVEDATDGYIVGTLSTADEDADDTHTYTLSGEDADQFEVVNGQLKLREGIAADYESKETYSVTVTSTDSGGATTETTFTLNVVTTIDLSSFSFAENSKGAVVGDLSVTDESFSSNVTYTLSGTDADNFEIVNNQLKLKDNVAANFEVQDSYSIIITVTDDAGLEAAINFTLSVTDENDAPTAVTISQDEPEPPGPTPNPGDGETVRVSVTVVNGQFYFDGQLQTDYELIAGNTYIFEQSPANGGGHVLGISNTSGGSPLADLTYFYNGTQTSASTYDLYLVTYGAYFLTSQFEISYTVPEDGPGTLYFFSTSSDVTGGTFTVSSGSTKPPPPPVPVDPDAVTINENELGATVGSLITTDEDSNDTHTYTLGGTDADLFEIVDGILKLRDGVSVNYEQKNSLNIIITATDGEGLSFDQALKINLNDVNEQPTDITLTSVNVDENIAGAVIGIIESIDEDTNDSYSYTFSGADADKFEVIDGKLKFKDNFTSNFEDQASFQISITSTDSGGLSVTKDFVISLNDVNEPVTQIKLQAKTIEEGKFGQSVGQLIIDDPDIGEIRSYFITGEDARYFEVDSNGVLKLKDHIALDYESLTSDILNITVTVIESQGFTAIQNFSIEVINTIDSPTDIVLNTNMININEPSGHIICRDLVSTGDGTIAALKVISSLLILEKDPEDILRNYSKMPQININVEVENKDILSDSNIQKKLKEVESDLTVGRLLVRPSGTESKIRVMVESDDEITASKYANDIAQMFKK